MNLFLRKPRKTIFELTNRCNLKCKMCSIWSEKDVIDFDFNLFKSILSENIMKSASLIALTGGEPFLLPNLCDYYNAITEILPKTKINISTNGFSKNLIRSFLSIVDQSKIAITISYDGIKSHDIIRNNDNSRSNLVESAIMINNHFPQVELSMKFTISQWNYNEILQTALQAESLNIPLRFKVVENLNCHHNRGQKQPTRTIFIDSEQQIIINELRQVLKLSLKTNTKFIKKLINKFKRNLSAEIDKKTCNWLPNSLFIDLSGHLFFCRKFQNAGNVNQKSLTKIIQSSTTYKIHNYMKKCNDRNCISFTHE